MHNNILLILESAGNEGYECVLEYLESIDKVSDVWAC